ncbi:hypothetical protein BX600DRAFT_432471 [Xylariales sp. PMI_506]|nr:hypothetical protein BX600DRAFT_432471 [Xylariales sp. PMI_506]
MAESARCTHYKSRTESESLTRVAILGHRMGINAAALPYSSSGEIFLHRDGDLDKLRVQNIRHRCQSPQSGKTKQRKAHENSTQGESSPVKNNSSDREVRGYDPHVIIPKKQRERIIPSNRYRGADSDTIHGYSYKEATRATYRAAGAGYGDGQQAKATIIIPQPLSKPPPPVPEVPARRALLGSVYPFRSHEWVSRSGQ